MSPDLRIRNSTRSTPIPGRCRAFTFVNLFDRTSMTILSDHPEKALHYFKDFMLDQGVDLAKDGWITTPYVDDFHVVLLGDVLPRK